MQKNCYFLIGFMASGKTTVGKMVAHRTGYRFIDLDELIESAEGKSVSQIFAEQGEEYFRKLEKQYLQEVMQNENTIIATGGGVPCFFDNMDCMNGQGTTIYLKFAPEQLKARLELSSQNKRPLVAGRKGNELLQYITDSLSVREPYYNKASYTLQGSDEEIAEQIVNIISAK